MKIFKVIKENWVSAFRLITAHPSILMPFLLLGLAEALWLSLWYYAPRPPVSAVLAPLIKAFMGGQYLHYPMNFLALPRLVFIGRVLGYMSVGLIALAVTVLALAQIEQEKVSVRWAGNMNRALRRYFSLFLPAMLYALLAFLIYKVPRLVIAKTVFNTPLFPALSSAVFFGSFIFLVLLECSLIFSVPFMLIFRYGPLESLKKSLLFFFSNFIPVLSFVLFLRGLNLLMIMVKNKSDFLINKFFPLYPEAVLVFLGMDIAIFFVANAFIVILAAELLLRRYKTSYNEKEAKMS